MTCKDSQATPAKLRKELSKFRRCQELGTLGEMLDIIRVYVN
ncbi:hypothetical protein HMPREF1982_02559 [Clostridiales bacterium oral taxon 876 str. F0540]|nr:hypothetical protein HMPREF1982_02559 [Clostridiales bacterium oral taxon 876 str. F0540]